ncbi:hypothetical protein DH2020_020894 [Rehmannia glutinosa]|uniref:BHLH domain-containing protein n=1 Tax=Rehmannia glutinosa TaxID=99300 RepID=A0ABR0WCM6_REHGL
MSDHFLPGLENLKHSFSLSETDSHIQFTNQFPGTINPSHQQPFGLPIIDNLFPHLLESPGLFIHHEDDNCNNLVPHIIPNDENDNGDRKRKAMEISSPENSSPQGSDIGIRRKNSAGRGKKMKGNNEKKEEKPREVVHVRAKRGQATDSHSLAERVRREKINERLRCLQDIVPGCYKTMGMAVMLDEIINYVQSLQNQVEVISFDEAHSSKHVL